MSTATSPSSTISTSSLPVASLGTPRIGPRRELKFALESFWSGASDEKALIEAGAGLRAANWARQKKLGVSVIPSNDFSFYDQMLDTSVMVGAIPEIYRWNGGPVPLATYFAMARGAQGKTHEASLRPCPSRARGRARRARAGNDKMVRHQLPLHGARTDEGSAVQPRLAQADRGIRGSQGAGLSDPPRAGRTGHVS